MSKVIRIGGACGFLGDSSTAPPQLIAAGVDYLMLDYLAEVTMSFLAQAKKQHAAGGYARDFTEWVWKDNIADIAAKKVRIVTNAGGTNPAACRERMLEIARAQGYEPRIAIVEGDDLLPLAADFAKADVREMFSDAAFPDPGRVAGINAYLGAFAIARAFQKGADHVITGRVVDSALALAVCIHEFGWKASDYDKLASGTLIGHILECGAQATGGLHTDWKEVPDWAHIGYPIAECRADGSFVVTKPDGSGGLVSTATVAEQMLYEIGDPQAYIVPDVVCDFSGTTFRQVGKDRVEVAGVRGYPPTGTYKVCATYHDGFRATSLTPLVGIDAAAKAQRQCDAILTRTAEMLRGRNIEPYRATRIDVLGSGATYGRNPEFSDAREVVAKISVEHEDETAMKIFVRECASPITSMSVGTTSWYGLEPRVVPIVRLFSFLLPKKDVVAIIELDGEQESHRAEQPAVFDPAAIVRPAPDDAPVADEAMTEIRLVDLVYARSGDKGDAFNVGVIARKPSYLPYVRAALTPERFAEAFAHEFEGDGKPRIDRFDLPGVQGLNFLAHGALGGGGAATMRVDMLAKGKAQQLLDQTIPIPLRLVRDIEAAASQTP